MVIWGKEPTLLLEMLEPNSRERFGHLATQQSGFFFNRLRAAGQAAHDCDKLCIEGESALALSRLDDPTVLHKYVSGGKQRALLKYPALPRKVTQWGRRCGSMWLLVKGGHK